MTGLPAAVVISHDKPHQLRRLLRALDPLPVFLHVDAHTTDDVHRAMTRGLPARVRLLPRIAAGWARVEVLEAELSGYRAALEETDADHVILLTGADYPLRSTAGIVDVLASRRHASFGEFSVLPKREWGVLGGYDRFVLPQWPEGRRRRFRPVPRRAPTGLRRGGGAQAKVLSRGHVEYLLSVLERRPDVRDFLCTCWTPDEVAIPTLLVSDQLGGPGPGSPDLLPSLFFTEWGTSRRKNPHWLGADDLPALQQAARGQPPALFARKFDDDADVLCDLVDAHLRSAAGTGLVP